MVAKAGGYTFLGDGAFAGEADALNDVPLSLAGRTRFEYELLTGRNPFQNQNEPPCTPRNPDGRLGHNHRGPPWGSAFRHPIAWITGKKSSVNIEGATQAIAEIPNGTTENPGRAEIRNWLVWVPPYWKPPSGTGRLAPYGKLYLKFLGFASSAAATDIEVTARMRVPGGEDTELDPVTIRFSTTSEAAATLPGGEPSVLTESGYNLCDINFVNKTARSVTLSSIVICQTKKRHH